jgi:hypothetical protein
MPSLDLETLVQEFASLTEGFEDLNFPDRAGQLLVRSRVPQVQSVRIEVPSSEALELRLGSVLVEADGLDDPVAQTTLSGTLPANKAAKQILESRRLLDPDHRGLGLHTRARPRPWLELTFDQPVDLRSVLIRNVGDEQAAQARGIQVMVRTTDGWWTTIYDGLDRERQFRQRVEHYYAGRLTARRFDDQIRRRFAKDRPTADHGVEADLVKVLTSIQLHDYGNLFRDLDRIALEPEEVSHFRKLVTDQIVSRRELEWNIHGIRRTFRYWSEQERQEYVGFAVDVVDCLRQLSNDVCFGFGSALAIVRDHELIPHDDDLDVLIAFEQSEVPTLAHGLAMIEKCLQAKGFVVTGQYTSYRWVLPPDGRGSKLDAFVGLYEGDKISWYPGKRGALTRQMMFPAEHREFHGHQCAVPREPEQYLEQIYGPGWTTPNPHFRHTWRRSAYKDIMK